MCQDYVDNCMIGTFNCKKDDAARILPEVRISENRTLEQVRTVMGRKYNSS